MVWSVFSRCGESYCTYRGIDRGIIERATIGLPLRIPRIFIFKLYKLNKILQ